MKKTGKKKNSIPKNHGTTKKGKDYTCNGIMRRGQEKGKGNIGSNKQ